MNKYINQTPAVRFVILCAGSIIILTAIQVAASFLIPILLAVIFAVLFWPPLVKLEKRGMSTGSALGVVLVGVLIINLIFMALMSVTITNFADSLPFYQERLAIQLDALGEIVRGWGIQPGESRLFAEGNNVNLGSILTYVFSGLSQLFGYGFIILFYVLFMLVEAATFQKKIKAAFHNNPQAYDYAVRVMDSLQYYLIIKTRINALTGAFIGGCLWLVGLDFAILWGFIAFMLNYIPNFGSIIAAVPAVILTFIMFGPSWQLGLVIAIYVGVNLIVGYWLEPKMMGEGLGLSALVVLVAVVFWGWILGPIGLILSVPITVAFKIVLEGYEGSRWVSIMLGSGEDLE